MLLRVLVLNLAVAVAKLALGYSTGAVSVISDGFHSLTDSASNVMGLVGLRAARKPPDDDHPYGHRKYETLAAAGIFVFLLFVVHRGAARRRCRGCRAAPPAQRHRPELRGDAGHARHQPAGGPLRVGTGAGAAQRAADGRRAAHPQRRADILRGAGLAGWRCGSAIRSAGSDRRAAGGGVHRADRPRDRPRNLADSRRPRGARRRRHPPRGDERAGGRRLPSDPVARIARLRVRRSPRLVPRQHAAVRGAPPLARGQGSADADLPADRRRDHPHRAAAE